ncbi:alpha/beta fold hydrolase [Variovorax saccharolyticus]|uniref:alpha/beta fold hydrolase n=1 Tax=Variovorax saccharolyticus TaxID=3053516 RepID=UPI00257917A1|nr:MULTISPECIES: alpha/beta fold hydrolase [unclassified Variovorax]MDM0016489.1 alpha/beta fold hydrolase [Variovorax sp. J22R187]MDM0023036.1 alpha/beta fold hydrolase [Variovorax sp. J31P216]
MVRAADGQRTAFVHSPQVLINYIRRGQGKPLLLVHGLGSSWRTWQSVLEPLAAERAVVAIDLPGFGKSPPLDGEVSVRTLASAVARFLAEHDLLGVDAVGSSMGARLVLELARRGEVLGAVVSLGPAGFWTRWERMTYQATLCLSMRLARGLKTSMPTIAAHDWSRTLLLARFSPEARRLSPALVLEEMQSYATAESFSLMLKDSARGPPLEGSGFGTLAKPAVIGWGRLDRICHPRQAARAQQSFPDARLHWFERCGHYPHWDQPEQTARLILDTTAD